jgi:ribosomal protein S18 acetylase RimI-like enzyme
MRQKNYFEVPEAPPIEGLKFRSYCGKADHAVIVQVFNACKTMDDIKYTLTEEDTAHHFAHLERSDPFTDMFFVEVHDDPIAYARVGWYPESEGDCIYYGLGWVHPGWRRQGIGTAVLKQNERRIREIAAGHPEGAAKFFQNEYSDKQPGVKALMKANGYREVRWGYEMSRSMDDPLPEAPLPEGLEVRPATCEEHFRAIFQAENEAFRDHWGHVEATEESYQRWRTQPLFEPELWKVAWDGAQVAGMVLNFLNRDENAEFNRKRGYTENISVRRPYRRRGLARALLVQSIRMFREMGLEETALGVDTQNPNQALRLYESVGYRLVEKHTTVRKPLEEK